MFKGDFTKKTPLQLWPQLILTNRKPQKHKNKLSNTKDNLFKNNFDTNLLRSRQSENIDYYLWFSNT